MKLSRIPRRSGRRAPEPAARRARLALPVLVVALALTSCNYGFEGGGFPAHIQTIYIESFDNETPQFDLPDQLYSTLTEELPRQLGVRPAGREAADAILRGTITRYDDVAQNYRAGQENQPTPDILSHEVQIGISAALIDVRDNVIRWEATNLIGRGSYRPDNENEETGQQAAIENLIELIIDGAQSQW